MDLRSTSTDEIEDPPILYLRNAILVRDPARADAALSPEAREWRFTILLCGLAAVVGSALGMFTH